MESEWRSFRAFEVFQCFACCPLLLLSNPLSPPLSSRTRSWLAARRERRRHRPLHQAPCAAAWALTEGATSSAKRKERKRERSTLLFSSGVKQRLRRRTSRWAREHSIFSLFFDALPGPPLQLLRRHDGDLKKRQSHLCIHRERRRHQERKLGGPINFGVASPRRRADALGRCVARRVVVFVGAGSRDAGRGRPALLRRPQWAR